jgi:hypothetical protein
MLEPGIIFFVGLLCLACLFLRRAAKIEALEQHGVRVVAGSTLRRGRSTPVTAGCCTTRSPSSQEGRCRSWWIPPTTSATPCRWHANARLWASGMKCTGELSFLTYESRYFRLALAPLSCCSVGLPRPLAAFRSFSVSGFIVLKSHISRRIAVSFILLANSVFTLGILRTLAQRELDF